MTAKRCLIVNADDYNTDPERNRGIIKTARDGILTSASVLANMPGRDEAINALAQVLGPCIGVHLNLTRGKPLCGDERSLTGKQGVFLPKQASWRRALQRGYNISEVKREWTAQIEAVCRSGLQPDHLDSNNHLHVFPGCARVCAELARRFNIRSVRLPLEPLRLPGLCGRSGIKRLFLALLAIRARSLFREYGLCMPDRVFGIAFPAPGDRASFVRFLKKMPSGVSELMCHPGYAASGSQPFSCAQREQELRVLTCPSVRGAISREGISLVSFGDVCR
jgi:predicted glycoside hydrolase/deacetylase ChbG (UPF0249 family)